MSLRALEAAWGAREVDGTPRLVMYALAGHHNDATDLCCPSLATLADGHGIKRRALIDAINWLEKHGYIRRIIRNHPSGGRRSNAYDLCFASHERLSEFHAKEAARKSALVTDPDIDAEEWGDADGGGQNAKSAPGQGAARRTGGGARGRTPLTGKIEQGSSLSLVAKAIWSALPKSDVIDIRRRSGSVKDVETKLESAVGRGHRAEVVAEGLRRYYDDPETRRDGWKWAKGAQRMIENDRWASWSPPDDWQPPAAGEPAPLLAWNGESRPTDPIGTLENPGERRQRAWMREWTEGQQHLWRVHERGPKPGEQYCRVWPEILREHGIEPFGES